MIYSELCRALLLIALLASGAPFLIAQEPDSGQEPDSEQVANSEAAVLAEVNRLSERVYELYQAGRFREAIAAAKRGLEIQEKTFGPNHFETATFVNDLWSLHQSLGELELASEYRDRALAIVVDLGPDDLENAQNLHDLGRMLKDMGELSPAKAHLERALAIRESALDPKHPKIAESLGSLGSLLFEMDDFPGAKPYLERSLAILEEALGPENPDTVLGLQNLGILHLEMGDPSGARSYLEKALSVSEKAFGPEHPFTGNLLNLLGDLFRDMGELKDAKIHYERALAIDEKIPESDPEWTSILMYNLGSILNDLGDLKGAKAYYERALALREEFLGPNHPATAQSLHDLGSLLATLGDRENARLLLRRSLAIREEVYGPEHPSTADSLDTLGGVLQDMGDRNGAELHYERALAIREKALGPEHPRTATSLNALGTLHADMGDFEGARRYHERALAIREKALGPEHRETAESLSNLAFLLTAGGDVQGALPYVERALAIAERTFGPRHHVTAIALSNLAALHMARGEIEQALKLDTRALEIEDQLLRDVLSIGSEKEKQLFLDTLTAGTFTTISFHVRSAPTDPRAARLALTTILRRKGSVLDAQFAGLRALRENPEPESRELAERLKRLRDTRAVLSLHPPKEPTQEGFQAQLRELDEKIRETAAELASRNSAFQESIEPVSLEAVQAKLAEQTALVEFFVYVPFVFQPGAGVDLKKWEKPRYIAYVLRRSGEPRWVDLGEMETIDTVAQAFWRAVVKQRADVLERSRELDKLIMAPVRPLLGNASTLVLSPDGALSTVPFAALVDEEGRYLIERYRLSYVTSGRDLLRPAAAASREAPVVLGGADFDGSLEPGSSEPVTNGGVGLRRSADMGTMEFSPLPGTAREARAIGEILGLPSERILTGSAATEEAIRAVSGPRILHLATHGFYVPDPTPESGDEPDGTGDRAPSAVNVNDLLLRSGLALTGVNRRREAAGANDGVLTALEIMDLDLWGTELAVLSACETGFGYVSMGQGVFGLRRALILAGARTQLTNLWRIADRPTQALMVSWYEQLQKGVPRAEALRRIQLAALRGKPLPASDVLLSRGGEQVALPDTTEPRLQGTRHPYFWSSFILVGETGPLPHLGLARQP